MKGSKILIQTLIGCGTDTIFGYPGNYVLDIYDELYAERAKIRHIETCHEQHACHAADGYARASGRAGVVLATSGPGATNLVTGIASAYMDSVPLVAITGNVPAAILGRDNFQEVDIAGITMPVTKHNFIVKDVSELEATTVRAFEIAESGRRGPVLIDLPCDVITGRAPFRGLKRALEPPRAPSEEELKGALSLIRAAKRPLILTGGGVTPLARRELGRFRELTGIPAVVTMAGVTSTIEKIGMAGVYGDPAANLAIGECDLLIALGTRFSDRVTGALPPSVLKKLRLLHVDADGAELGKTLRPALGIRADAGEFLRLVNDRLSPSPSGISKEWPDGTMEGATIGGQNASRPSGSDDPLSEYAEVLDAVRRMGPAINLATDVGLHQVFTARHFPFNTGDCFVSSCGLGAMGFGLGAAMGAHLANGRPTLLLTGDGSLRMNLQELVTLARLRLPLTVLVLNNASLGMVRRIQERNFGGRVFETEGIETDFVRIAKAMGVRADLALSAREAAGLLEGRPTDGPALIDLRIPPEGEHL